MVLTQGKESTLSLSRVATAQITTGHILAAQILLFWYDSVNAAYFEQISRNFGSKRILVIGDLMLDEFVWGKVSRISAEAPVPVVNVTAESYYPGGAANVARNVREFTCNVAVMGGVGTDLHGDRLLELLLASGIDTFGLQQDAAFRTTVKTRIIAHNQQVVRVDRERATPLTDKQTGRAIECLESMIGTVDGIIVADYGKGFLTQPLADYICRLAKVHHKILTVDPHAQTSHSWSGATAIKPNRIEALLAAGIPLSEPVDPVLSDQALLDAGKRLLGRWKSDSLLITLGEQGMVLFQKEVPPITLEPNHRLSSTCPARVIQRLLSSLLGSWQELCQLKRRNWRTEPAGSWSASLAPLP